MGMAIGAGFVFAAIIVLCADFPHHLLYVLYEVCGESYRTIDIYAEMDRKGVEPFF